MNKVREPKRHVKDQPKAKADWELFDELGEEVLWVNKTLQNKEKDVRQEDKGAHRERVSLFEYQRHGTDGASSQSRVGDDRDA